MPAVHPYNREDRGRNSLYWYNQVMEQDIFSEHLPRWQEKDLQSQDDLEALAEKLGFVETIRLSQIRDALTEAYACGAERAIPFLIEQYQMHGETVVEQQQGQAYAAAQVGLIIATARLRRDVGMVDAALEDIKDAAEYAGNIGLDDVAAELLSSSEIADALAPFEDDGLDIETRVEIALMPFDEAFEAAYGCLMQAGLDADEILASFMEE